MTDIRVLVDKDLKKDVDKVFKSLDLTMSQRVRLFLKQVAKYKELPFNPYSKPRYNKETEMAIKDVKEKKGLTSFDSFEESKQDIME